MAIMGPSVKEVLIDTSLTNEEMEMNKLLFVVAAVCFTGITHAADTDSQRIHDSLQCQRFAEIMPCESMEPRIVEPSGSSVEHSADVAAPLLSAEELQCQRFAEIMSCDSMELSKPSTHRIADTDTTVGR
jgi:hypothetical protein